MFGRKPFGFSFFSKNKPRVFGVDINKISLSMIIDDVPLFLTDAGQFIMGNIVEGIFRIPGERQLADNMKKTIERKGDFLSLVKRPLSDVHAVASVILMFLRELPEPLITFESYDLFIDCAKTYEIDQYTKSSALSVAINTFHAIVKTLPQRNLKILAFYMNLFYVFTINSDVHKMQANNVAICIAPTLLRSQKESWESAISSIKYQSIVCTFLIKYYPLIFRDTCDTKGLLYPQYQNVSNKDKNKLLNQMTKTVRLSTPEKPKRKARKSIWEDFRKDLKTKDKEVEKKHMRSREMKKTQFTPSTLKLVTADDKEKEEIKEEIKKKRPKSESMALAIMFIDNNDNTILLPQLNQQDILKQLKFTTIKGQGKLKINNFKVHTKKEAEQ
ncbi:hypothetical protein, conserved [Entamoeba dispar SAW760]|uniref:Rho-GAP domain-containing protein n=1 Tax=Entamoeba dispar (strain ATCC PRA-260 / SAW760) TaxID=370354 RepID=B0ECJ0_ENTDS|nr:uncharacterized protein EDI_263590 [Entamoeba dispar SAW760]EDR27750.1 hypothetical protein, conserved [Entamoeba dispar SAW760]|eukprot:EDR27750.1 hypothetical protein, conserved [Entamoeba dispar SAW760]